MIKPKTANDVASVRGVLNYGRADIFKCSFFEFWFSELEEELTTDENGKKKKQLKWTPQAELAWLQLMWCIDNIPLLGRNKLNEIRRFVILIDILYEKKSKIYIRSEKKLLEMFDVKKSLIPFQRTVSRISEMTSKQWGNN